MGKVAQTVREMLKKQIDDRGIVVWYDPGRQYEQALPCFDFPDTTVLRLTDSVFRLRAEVEASLEYVSPDGTPATDCAVPPRLLVYAPIDRGKLLYALSELECAGVVMEPGAADPACNTRLRVVAEQVFKSIRPDKVDEIGRKADDGTYTLEELDKIAESGPVGIDILAEIFETNNADEIRLKFLTSDAFDKTLVKKKALGELTALFAADMGITVPQEADCAAVRQTAARLLLMGDLISRLPSGSVPSAWQTIPVSDDPVHRQKMQELAGIWRNRIDLREAYIDRARLVEQETGLASADVPPALLQEIHTFPLIDLWMLHHVEGLILEQDVPEALALIGKRKLGFWSVNAPPNDLRWAVLESAAGVLFTGEDVRGELKQVAGTTAALLQAYVRPSSGWFHLDTLYRHMERQYATFDLDLSGEHDKLEQVVIAARHAYTAAVEKLTASFAEALQSGGFRVPSFPTQTSVFEDHLKPALASGRKIAYLVVDALRYDMGRELADSLAGDFETECLHALAQLPTITAVGMAAVLPGAGNALALEPKGKGGFSVSLCGENVSDRPSRIKYLTAKVSRPTLDLKLNDLVKPSKKKQESIREAEFLYVTSQEIDRLGEGGEDEDEVRLFMDDVLEKLGKGIRRLAALGVEEIIVVADHGHLFAAPLDSGMKIDPPGGQTAELHRRVWIGNGGAAGAGYARASASDLGLGGSLEFAFPSGLAGFKAKGAGSAYMHGGTSLQEMVVPVIRLRPVAVKPEQLKAATVALELPKPTITTRFFSTTLTYRLSGLFGPDTITVKLAVRSGRKEVGVPAVAAYGFEESTREVQLRKDESNPVTIMLTDADDLEKVTVQVLDAGSQVELARIDGIPVQITI